MFGGSFVHNLDSAGRFVMPKQFRFSLGMEFVITRGLGCLCVFTKDFMNGEITVPLGKLGTGLQSVLNPDIVRLNRHFYMDMATTKADSQNRVPLTPEHRRFARIKDEIVICGCGDYLELWSPEALAECKLTDDMAKIIASGEKLLPGIGRRAVGEADAGVSQAGPA